MKIGLGIIDYKDLSIPIKGIPPVCTQGETKCVGNIKYTCINGNFVATGYCVTCTEGKKKCENGIEYTCINNEWVQTGTCEGTPIWVLAFVVALGAIGIALYLDKRKT